MEFTFHNSFFILELVPSSDFLDAKIQGYVAPRLKSTLQKFYVRHHNLVDNDNGSFTFYVGIFFPLSLPLLLLDLTV